MTKHYARGNELITLFVEAGTKGLSNREVRRKLMISGNNANYHLQTLRSRGIIKKVGAARATRYVVIWNEKENISEIHGNDTKA